MPLYEYECVSCGVFSALRKMSESSGSAICKECGRESGRIISTPHLAILGKAQRAAHELNEKSAHEPRTARRSSCGCTGTHSCNASSPQSKSAEPRSSSKSAANPQGFQMQTRKTARPWMVGH